MTWASFFKSREFAIQVAGFTIGTAATAYMSSLSSSACASAANYLSKKAESFTIPEVNGICHFEKYSAAVTIDNLNAVLPASVIEMLNDIHELAGYCYYVPFTIGLFLTTFMTISLSNWAAISEIHDQQEKEAVPTGYVGLNC